MGDDLTFAQEFVDQTTMELQAFFAQSSRPAAEALVAAMTRIQSGAKILHARGVYQSAQSVLTALQTVPENPAQTDGRLLALNKLIAQYADGLAELVTPAETSTPDILELDQPIADEVDHPIQAVDPANDYETAKATLAELLPFAASKDAAALTHLMQVSDPDYIKVEPRIPLESVMRDIVQDALGIARICGKTISVSYEVGDTALTQDKLSNLQVRLSQTLRAMILETLPADKVGHIDLVLSHGELCLMATGPSPQFTPRVTRKVFETGQTHLFLALEEPEAAEIVQAEPKAPRRMITDETEGELRAKLSQLMDGSLALSDDTLAEAGR